MSRKKIISVILAHLMLLVCVTACQAASPQQAPGKRRRARLQTGRLPRLRQRQPATVRLPLI